MAYSHKTCCARVLDEKVLRVGGAALAMLVGAALSLLMAPGAAHAASSLEERVAEPVYVEAVSATTLLGSQSVVPVLVSVDIAEASTVSTSSAPNAPTLSLPRISPVLLATTCSPQSIEAGIDCGMEDMCGLYPCLCGSADAWGGCSCNGYETRSPEVTFASSDEGVVRVVEAFDRLWLLAAGSGTAVVTCTASLPYYENTSSSFEVNIGGPTVADAALIGMLVIGIAMVVAVCVLLVKAVRVGCDRVRHRSTQHKSEGGGRA